MRLLSLLLAVASAASCQTAAEILRSAADRYHSLKSYRFEAEYWQESSMDDGARNIFVTTQITATDTANRVRRIEWRGGPLAALRIYDGHNVWEFRKSANQFARADQAGYEPVFPLVSDPMETYGALDKAAARAKLLREETIEAAGGQRACWVIEVSPDSAADNGPMRERLATTYWIDKSTHLVLKVSEQIRVKSPRADVAQTQMLTSTYKVASVNEPVAAELFHFEPPPGAVEVAKFPRPAGPGTPLPQTAGPDFTLSDLKGETVSLTSLKGKAVLLNFWATWCAPCVAEMPEIEQAQRRFADKGLVVLAIDDGEDPDKVRKFMAEHGYTFRVLLDRDESVGHQYSVAGWPSMFFIDREGYIRAQYRGYNTRNLMDDLKKIDIQ
jgi:peroxiredoxin/outer membrane lipoprotein-sorting protein